MIAARAELRWLGEERGVAGHLFISYSTLDSTELALKLADELSAGPPEIPVWLDKRDIRPGEHWDEQIVEAIRGAKALLFLMTKDSVQPLSGCKDEWDRALRYKKPILPLLFDLDAEVPFRLGSREYIDFTGSFDAALARLRNHLRWMDTPEGQLQHLRYRHADAQREFPRAQPSRQARIREEIEDLKRQIAGLQAIIDNPAAAAQRVRQSIERGLELVRETARPEEVKRTRFINPPPAVAPTWFQDRHFESGQIGNFLMDGSLRLLTVTGRGGIGKSAMVCRLLKSLEAGQLPDDRGALAVDGIVYLSNARSFHRVTVPELFAGLTKLLSEDAAARLDAVYKNPQAGTRETMQALLNEFGAGRTVVLLDNFEEAIEAGTGRIKDSELFEALSAFLDGPPHGLKAIITTRVAPADLAAVAPGRQRRLDLDKGLKHPFAENVLRAMDDDGILGLRDAPEALLAEARERTRGNPRALEHLYGILSADRDTTLKEILEDTRRMLPEKVVDVLVGEAFNRLEPAAQRTMIALATFRYPVPAAAVDFLLEPYVAGVDSAPVLKRLVNMLFTRRESGRYYLHQVDRDYALSRIDQGAAGDWALDPAPFTRLALTHRAAEWFQQTRKAKDDWKSLEDLAPQLCEFELRLASGECDEAARIVLEIDFNYLMLWGHFHLATTLHERLQDRIWDPELAQSSVGNLGTAYYRIGRYQQAIACYELAGSRARERGDTWSEAVWLGNLGVVYAGLGQSARAVQCYQQALAMRAKVNDRSGEARDLINIGIEHRARGDTEKAIQYYRRALEIDRERDSLQDQAVDLHNLGEAYADLGDSAEALARLAEAHRLALLTGHRLIEMAALNATGMIHVDRGDLAAGLERFERAIELADNAGANQIQCEGRIGMALARLYAGDLAAAREAAEAARRIDFPLGNNYASLVAGIVALRQGDHAAAVEAFSAALSQSESLLSRNPESYDALYVKSLALCGLTVAGNSSNVSRAREALEAARLRNAAPGVLGRFLRLFDALAQADSNRLLSEARAAAAGA